MGKKIALLPLFICLFASGLIAPGSLLVSYLSTKESYQGKLMNILAMKSPVMPIEAIKGLVQSEIVWIISVILSIVVVFYFSGSKKEGIK